MKTKTNVISMSEHRNKKEIENNHKNVNSFKFEDENYIKSFKFLNDTCGSVIDKMIPPNKLRSDLFDKLMGQIHKSGTFEPKTQGEIDTFVSEYLPNKYEEYLDLTERVIQFSKRYRKYRDMNKKESRVKSILLICGFIGGQYPFIEEKDNDGSTIEMIRPFWSKEELSVNL